MTLTRLSLAIVSLLLFWMTVEVYWLYRVDRERSQLIAKTNYEP